MTNNMPYGNMLVIEVAFEAWLGNATVHAAFTGPAMVNISQTGSIIHVAILFFRMVVSGAQAMLV